MNAVLSVVGTIFMVLLFILLVLLLLVCFLLFCPICYKAKAEFGEKLLADGRVCWLLGLVWVTFAFQEGEFTSKIRLFGMDLQKVSAWRKKRRDRKKADRKKQRNKSNKEASRRVLEADSSLETKKKPEYEKIPGTEAEKKSEAEKMPKLEAKTESKEEPRLLQERSEGKETKKEKKNFIRALWQKLKDFIRFIKTFFKSLASLCKKIKKKTDWAKDAKKFWKSANTQRMVCILKDNVIHLWRKLKPKVLRGNIFLGTGDPCSTGEILGVAAIFYAAYGRRIQVTPDFETARFEGNLFIKGRISLITIVIILIRIFLSGEWSQFKREAERLKEAF